MTSTIEHIDYRSGLQPTKFPRRKSFSLLQVIPFLLWGTLIIPTSSILGNRQLNVLHFHLRPKI